VCGGVIRADLGSSSKIKKICRGGFNKKAIGEANTRK